MQHFSGVPDANVIPAATILKRILLKFEHDIPPIFGIQKVHSNFLKNLLQQVALHCPF